MEDSDHMIKKYTLKFPEWKQQDSRTWWVKVFLGCYVIEQLTNLDHIGQVTEAIFEEPAYIWFDLSYNTSKSNEIPLGQYKDLDAAKSAAYNHFMKNLNFLEEA